MLFDHLDLDDRIRKADWWHHYSDDYTVRERARARIDQIHADLRSLWQQYPEIARRIWKENAPQGAYVDRWLWENPTAV